MPYLVDSVSKRRKIDPCHESMSLALPLSLKVADSPTARLISVLTHLKELAAKAGYKQCDMVLANIGDITGVPELPVMKEARSSVVQAFNNSTNPNGYPPYPGLTQLRHAVASDLMCRLGFADQGQDGLIKAGVLLPHEDLAELVSICAGSVGCSGSICSHVKYHRMRRNMFADRGQSVPNKPVTIAMDRTHYWKHQGVAEDFGEVQIYNFLALQEGSLHLNANEAQRLGRDGGGIMLLNFANPFCFLPSTEESQQFAAAVAEWNNANPSQEITVCLDGPYDDFDGPEGYRFASLLLKAGVTTSYIHARTKEEFATGSRGGEVLCNNPAIRQLFNAYKADYIGSDSKLEQEIALHLHNSTVRDEQKLMRNQIINERKEYFWKHLGQHPELAMIRKDTAPFYRPTGPFYVFLNLQSLIPGKYADSMDVCKALAKLGVILVPGTLFDIDPDDAEGMNRVGVRIAFGSFKSESWQSQIKMLVGALTKLVKPLSCSMEGTMHNLFI
mmetsp:Transcript_39884/g.70153  ORF Transcript_39884/g.70153 Transcript_39884/m.70153 type:complete len:502 (+) Transcript_39884:80-1585(+)